MKKLCCLLLVLLLTLSCAALAEGKIEIKRQALFIDPDGGTSFYFGQLENTGDEIVYAGRGGLKVFDSKGGALVEKNIYVMGTNPALKPGETLFVREYIFDDLSNADVGGFECAFEQSDWGREYTHVPCEATYNISGNSMSENNVLVSVTNDTDETIFNFYVVAGIISTEGRLMFASQQIFTDIGINPHTTITTRIMLNSSLTDFWKANGIEFAGVEAEMFY